MIDDILTTDLNDHLPVLKIQKKYQCNTNVDTIQKKNNHIKKALNKLKDDLKKLKVCS